MPTRAVRTSDFGFEPQRADEDGYETGILFHIEIDRKVMLVMLGVLTPILIASTTEIYGLLFN